MLTEQDKREEEHILQTARGNDAPQMILGTTKKLSDIVLKSSVGDHLAPNFISSRVAVSDDFFEEFSPCASTRKLSSDSALSASKFADGSHPSMATPGRRATAPSPPTLRLDPRPPSAPRLPSARSHSTLR
jgi:hypothetical protein